MMGIREIRSVKEYLEIIKDCKANKASEGNTEDFLFRGQPADLPLIPKIGRLEPKMSLLATEQFLLQEFKRTNPLLLGGQPPQDDWDYLTLGQHYGLPTRLLDWSNNALTALWFATQSAGEEMYHRREDAVVWILMAESTDFDLDIEKIHPFEVEKTKIFRPRIIKQRINNQSGVFSIQSSKEIEKKCKLNETDDFSKKLLKIKIPRNSFAEIRGDLNTFGVNAFTIFPDLDGLCNYLQWRYFY